MRARNVGSRILFRCIAALMLMLGVVSGTVVPAGAQGSNPGLVSDAEYESPQFDFTLSWDDPWALSEGTVDSTEGTLDQISLESPGGFLQIILIVPDAEPQAYLDALLENLQQSGTDYEEIGTDSGNGYISATVDFTIESQGNPLPLREYVEVASLETLDGGEALFTGSLLSTVDGFTDEWEGLQDAVQRDGRDPVFLGVPEGIQGGSSTAHPTATSKPTSNGGIDGNTFVGPNYGFYVEWDGGLWEAEDSSTKTEDALVLSSDASQIQFRSYEQTDATNRTCVTDFADEFETGEGVTDYGRNSDYDLPEKGEGAYARLYDFQYQSGSDDPVTFLNYLECRPMGDEEGVFLLISLLTPEGNYEDEVVAYEDVVATLEFGKGGGPDLTTHIGRQGGEEVTPTRTSGKDPVLKSASYTGGAYGYRIVWDKAVWTAAALTPDDGYEGVKLTSEGSSAWIEALESYGGDPDDCVAQSGDDLNTFDGVSDVQEIRRPALPKTDPNASVAIYSYTYTSDKNDTLDFVEYIECRELVAGSAVLRVEILAVLDSYADLIPEWEELLGGIKIESTAATTTEPVETPAANSTGEDLPGVRGRKYTSPQFGFTLSWESSWTPIAATTGGEGTTLTLSNGTSTVLVFGGDFPADPADCVSSVAEVASSSAGVSNYQIVTDNDGAEQTGGDETFGYGIYSFTRGGDDFFDYLYCQPATTGEYVVAVIFQTPVGDFATEFPEFQTLLGALLIE